jgi:hypothetical protein
MQLVLLDEKNRESAELLSTYSSPFFTFKNCITTDSGSCDLQELLWSWILHELPVELELT